MSNIELIGNDYATRKAVESLKSNTKIYPKIMDALALIGDFNSIQKAELYEDDKKRTNLCLIDKNGDYFILCAKSDNTEDLSVIRKLTDKEDLSYDVSLIKACDLTKENIEVCRIDKQYNTRHGRIMSDKKSFLTFFTGGTNAYQLLGHFEHQIPIDIIIMDMNGHNTKPTFKEFVTSLEHAIPPYEMDNIDEINAFCCFERDGHISFKEEEKGKAKRKGTL